MFRSFFHWKVFVNLLLAIALFIGLVWLTFRWLEFHTNHGDEIPVPNVVNMTVQQAVDVLDDQGLQYEVDSFKFDPKFRPYQVLKIYPLPGSRVKDGRTIVLKVNPKTYAPVTIPDILDGYKGLAFRKLERLELKVGDTIYEPNIQKDAVIRMMYKGAEIKPGAKVPMFSTIDLVIGTGPKRNVTVPNLVGMTVAQAKVYIAQNLFEVGIIDHQDGGNDDSDIIYYQDPESGAVRDQGMQIDLWASKKTPAEMQSKIKELDEMYRPKIEVAPPAEDFSSPVEEPVKTVPAPQKQQAPPSNIKPQEEKSTTKKPAETKPTDTKTTEQKPAKRVVVE